MPFRGVCEPSFCSYFVIDRKFELVSFVIDMHHDLQEFLANTPTVGGNVEEMIAQQYRSQFLVLLSKSFSGKSFSVEKRFERKGAPDVLYQLVFTPLPEEEEARVVCTVINSNVNIGQLRLLNDYSQLTSHALRAPITNILSLSNTGNYAEIESFDIGKVNQLLSDINLQAEKLDEIIKTLSSILNKNEKGGVFEGGHFLSKNQHVVLVDDDKITNKIHHTLIKRHAADKQIVLFHDPEIALDYIEKYQPDLVLLDLHMPHIDGWKFLHMMELRNIQVAVIIVSSSIDPKDLSRAKTFTFVKYFVTKPLTLDKVKMIFESA